ncbi:hypothetical protein FOA52_005719 [Chlamydomonas sp. UWO 241]|nr:hypothetical protein FOA52_005719 [Chlamydomonas sp. UWO 241]
MRRTAPCLHPDWERRTANCSCSPARPVPNASRAPALPRPAGLPQPQLRVCVPSLVVVALLQPQLRVCVPSLVVVVLARPQLRVCVPRLVVVALALPQPRVCAPLGLAVVALAGPQLQVCVPSLLVVELVGPQLRVCAPSLLVVALVRPQLRVTPDASRSAGDPAAGAAAAAAAGDIAVVAVAVVEQVLRLLDCLDARGTANCAWASARVAQALTPRGSDDAVACCWSLCAALLGTRLPRVVHRFEPQHVSGAALALAALRASGGGVSSSGSSSSSSRSSGGVTAEEGARVEGVALPALLARSRNCPGGGLRGFGPQALANTLTSLGQLGAQPPEAWMCEAVDTAHALLPSLEPRHMSGVLWALAALRFHPGDAWLSVALQEAVPKLGVASPRVLANSLWALAVLGYRPPSVTVTHETDPHAQSRSRMTGDGDSSDGHCPSTPEVHLQSDPSLAVLMGRVLASAPEFGPQDCSNALWAMARLSRDWSQALPEQQASGALQLGTGSGSERGSGGGGGGARLWRRACVALIARAADVRASGSCQQLANTLWAASVLLPPPPGATRARSPVVPARRGGVGTSNGGGAVGPALTIRLRLVAHAALARLASRFRHGGGAAASDSGASHPHPHQPEEATSLALSVARLRLERGSPAAQGGSRWWPVFFAASLPLLPRASLHQVSNMAWAAAACGAHPPFEWLRAAAARAEAVLLSLLQELEQGELEQQVQEEQARLLARVSAVAGSAQRRLDPHAVRAVLWAIARLRAPAAAAAAAE